jgi:hypothetical protein
VKEELRRAILQVLANVDGLPAESVTAEILEHPVVVALLEPPKAFLSISLLWCQLEAGMWTDLQFYRAMKKIMDVR